MPSEKCGKIETANRGPGALMVKRFLTLIISTYIDYFVPAIKTYYK